MPFHAVWITVFILFQIVVTTDLTALNTVVTTVLTAFAPEVTTGLIAFHTVCITVLIPFHAVVVTVFIAFHATVIANLITSTPKFTIDLINSHTDWIIPLIEFHIVLVVVDIKLHALDTISFIKFTAGWVTDFILSHALDNVLVILLHISNVEVLILFHTVVTVSTIEFHTSLHLAFIVSQLLYNSTPTAINAVITPIAIPIGPLKAPIAVLKIPAPAPPALKKVTKALIEVDNLTINIITFPTINSNGPSTAKNPPTPIITFWIAGLRLLNQVNILVIPSTKFWNMGISLWPIVIKSPSKADFILSIAPCKLFCIVSYISLAAPSEFLIPSSNSLILGTPASKAIFTPFKASVPHIEESAISRSACVIPSVAFSTSASMSVISL